MTVTTFLKLYKHYKDTWSAEMRLWNTNTTYDEAFAKAQRAEEWL